MNFYCSREAVKRALSLKGNSFNSNVDSFIDAASREVENLTHRRFIPFLSTRYFRIPQRDNIKSAYVLYLDEDLLSVSALKANNGAKTIDAADFFLEPVNYGPPFDHIEMDLASVAFFSALDTPQRAVSIEGQWGYCNDTKAAGSVASGLSASASAASFVCSDASKVDVGDTLLIGDEQLFVSERGTVDTTATITEALGNNANNVTLTVDDGTKLHEGEVITIDSEEMLVEIIASNTVTVKRAYEGGAVASHDDNSAIYARRSLTVERGVNGTTAATHDDAAAISKYVAPADVANLTRALAIAYMKQTEGAWTGQIGGAENGVETTLAGLSKLTEKVKKQYRRNVVAFV